MSVYEGLSRELRHEDVHPSRGVRERVSTCIAFAVLLAVDAVMKLAGFHRFHQLVRRFPVRGSGRSRNERTMTQVSAAVDRAATLYFKRAWCLQRSATVVCLLRLRGVPAELVIGVRKMPFYGHAWAELDGRVLNDSPVVQSQYTVLERC